MAKRIRKLKEDGIALVFVILFSAILMVIAIGLTVLVISEIRQVSDVEDATQAFYSAESGIEYGMRFVLKGGTVRKDAGDECNDVKTTSSPTWIRSYVDGERVSWSELTGETIERQIEPGVNEYFMRISAVGESRGIRRRIVVDFTPNCVWDNPETSPAPYWGTSGGVTSE